MSTRTFALIYGIVFLVAGIAGFIPGLVQRVTPPGELTVGTGFGHLFGLFPVNVLHNLVHVVFGIWGLGAYRSTGAAVIYARSVAIVYAVLTVAGFIPTLHVLFGLVPLYGHDIWLHAVLALIAAYFGWVHREPAVTLRT